MPIFRHTEQCLRVNRILDQKFKTLISEDLGDQVIGPLATRNFLFVFIRGLRKSILHHYRSIVWIQKSFNKLSYLIQNNCPNIFLRYLEKELRWIEVVRLVANYNIQSQTNTKFSLEHFVRNLVWTDAPKHANYATKPSLSKKGLIRL